MGLEPTTFCMANGLWVRPASVFFLTGALGLAVVAASLVIGLTIWLVPRRQIADWRRAGVPRPIRAKTKDPRVRILTKQGAGYGPISDRPIPVESLLRWPS
jgi:hypothetical protein